jgi:hypothetical protein
MKHVKRIGLIAVAAMALVAFVGTASAAAAEEFHTGVVGAALSTKTLEKEVFSVTESPVECEVSKFEGQTEALNSETQKVHPVYEKCKAFGFSATVTTTGCTYTFSSKTVSEMGAVNVTGCTTEKAGEKGVLIKVSVPFIATCEVLIRNQNVPSAVRYTTNGSNMKVKATGSGIASNVVTSSGGCPLTTGKHEGGTTPAGGTYFGEAEVSAAGTFLKYE